MWINGVKFTRHNLNEVERFVGDKVSEIKIHLGPNFATLKLKQIGVKKTIKVNEGDYIIETNDAIPSIVPKTRYLKVIKNASISPKPFIDEFLDEIQQKS